MKEIVNDGFAKVVKPYMDAQDKKSREIIAPVEVSPAEAPHSVGDQIIYNGLLYDVIAPIAVNDALSTSGAGANIRASDNIEAQIKATKSQIQTAAAQAAAQNKKTQKMIAPVEEDETDASRDYAIGDQLILDGVLYNVIDAIAQHGIITSEGAGANIEEADDVTDQLSSLNQTLTNNVDVLSENSAINLLPIKCLSETKNNVTLTNNNDGSITVSGTASANTYFYLLGDVTSHLEIIEGTGKSYTLSGCTSGSGSTYALRMLGGTELGSWSTVGQIQTTEEMTFTEGTYTYYAVRLDVFSGASVNVTIKPMLVDSKYKGAYQPYSKTNRQLTEDSVDWDDMSQLGAVNVIPFSLSEVKRRNTSGTWNNNAYTLNGITFTVNDDGSFVVDGTASARTTINIFEAVADEWLEKGLPYIARTYNALFEDTTQDCFVQLFRSGSPWPVINRFDNTEFVVDNSYFDTSYTLSVQVVVNSGKALTNQTIKPLIAIASYNGDYVPYAKTNRELTEELTVEKTTVTNGASFQFAKYGKVVTLTISGSALGQNYSANDTICNVPSGYSPAIANDFLTTNKIPSTSDFARLVVQPDGRVTTTGALASTDGLRGSTTWIAS